LKELRIARHFVPRDPQRVVLNKEKALQRCKWYSYTRGVKIQLPRLYPWSDTPYNLPTPEGLKELRIARHFVPRDPQRVVLNKEKALHPPSASVGSFYFCPSSEQARLGP
jgi:hypothetical protein